MDNADRLSSEARDPGWQNQWRSPIPPHLTPEETAQWEEEVKWDKKEIERRKREGFYLYPKD